MPNDCPHCGIQIIIDEVNCGIFRCGIYKATGKQVSPHLSKEECEAIKNTDLIWGCCRPFMYKDGKLIVCDYI
jgi:hypothetical protein